LATHILALVAMEFKLKYFKALLDVPVDSPADLSIETRATINEVPHRIKAAT